MDGSLSTLGIIIGASAASPTIIISAGLGGTVANSIANIVSALSEEKAERYSDIRETEKAMVVKSLKKSFIDLKIRDIVFKNSLFDGFGTLIGGSVPIITFLFTYLISLPALLFSLLSVYLILFSAGIFIGRVTKENIILSALKMTLFGISVALIVYIIN